MRPNVPNIPTNWSLPFSVSASGCAGRRTAGELAILWDNLPGNVYPCAGGDGGCYGDAWAGDTQGIVLVVALAATGIALRLLRGRWWWSIAWYIAALLASLLQVVMQGISLRWMV